MQCIIPCAGGSSRMRSIPKNLLTVNGKPVLEHVIDLWKPHVDSFVIIMRREYTYLWPYIPENASIVFQDEPKGLSDAISRAQPYIKDNFVIALGDCLTLGIFKSPFDSMAVGVWPTSNEYEISKSYDVELSNSHIMRLKEKPIKSSMGLCGMGTYFMDARLFDYIKKGMAYIRAGGGDLTEILQLMIDSGETIKPNYFTGFYSNINNPNDLLLAEESLNKVRGVTA